MAFAAVPHERWARLAKCLHDSEHAGDDITYCKSASQMSAAAKTRPPR
jgi:hypothetical protein